MNKKYDDSAYADNDTVAVCQICRAFFESIDLDIHSSVDEVNIDDEVKNRTLDFINHIRLMSTTRDIYIPDAPEKIPSIKEYRNEEYFKSVIRFSMNTYKKYHKGMLHVLQESGNEITFIKKQRTSRCSLDAYVALDNLPLCIKVPKRYSPVSHAFSVPMT